MNHTIPIVLTPQPEGGYTVTSPLLPELVTEGNSVADAIQNVQDAMPAVIEIYEQLGRPLPTTESPQADAGTVRVELVVETATP
ncbi:MAG: type II toxin-antitoxin system HicB family antitoxin [Planctomycetota bacterium]